MNVVSKMLDCVE